MKRILCQSSVAALGVLAVLDYIVSDFSQVPMSKDLEQATADLDRQLIAAHRFDVTLFDELTRLQF